MKWIGLTGGIACGKSTVSLRLRDAGYPVIDADTLAHQVVAPGTSGLKSVLSEFGADLLTPEGLLDRRKLGQRVFGHPDRLRALEEILHPLIRKETERLKQNYLESQTPIVIYDIPLLFETKAEHSFDKIVVVTCTKGQQKERLQRKTQLSEEEIDMRIASQIPLPYKEERADFIVYNNKNEQHLLSEIKRLIDWLQSLA
jgi:dephospho-CoA kinase